MFFAELLEFENMWQLNAFCVKAMENSSRFFIHIDCFTYCNSRFDNVTSVLTHTNDQKQMVPLAGVSGATLLFTTKQLKTHHWVTVWPSDKLQMSGKKRKKTTTLMHFATDSTSLMNASGWTEHHSSKRYFIHRFLVLALSPYKDDIWRPPLYHS